MSKHGFQAQAEVRFIAVDDIMFNCCSHNEFISVTIKREVIATSAVARQLVKDTYCWESWNNRLLPVFMLLR